MSLREHFVEDTVGVADGARISNSDRLKFHVRQLGGSIVFAIEQGLLRGARQQHCRGLAAPAEAAVEGLDVG